MEDNQLVSNILEIKTVQSDFNLQKLWMRRGRFNDWKWNDETCIRNS